MYLLIYPHVEWRVCANMALEGERQADLGESPLAAYRLHCLLGKTHRIRD